MTIRTLTARFMARAFAAAMLLVSCFIGVSGASADESTLAEMNHESWTARDGAPQGVRALAQAPNGILWIGAEGGLSTFDGRTFSAFEPQTGDPDLPGGAVEAILAAHDGTIWVGFSYGGIARISQGRVRLFSHAEGIQLRTVEYIRQSSDGGLWALGQDRDLVRFGADGAWHVEPTPLGDAGGGIRDIFIDSSGTLWLEQGGRLYRRPLNQSRYFATEAQADWLFGFAETPEHNLWVNDSITNAPGHPMGRTQLLDRNGKLLARLAYTDNVYDILFAADGSLIVLPTQDGILRVSAQALAGQVLPGKEVRYDTYKRVDGLSSDMLRTMLLDSDGNLWTGGQRGLDRFRKARLVPFIFKNSDSNPHLCGGKTGDVWIRADAATEDLYKVSGDSTKLFPHETGQIYSMSCGRDGDTWLLANDGIFDVHADQIASIPSIPGTHPFDTHEVVAAPDRTLYASVVGGSDTRGIWRYADGGWTKLAGTGNPAGAPTTEYMDSRGRLWTGYRSGQFGLPLESAGRLLSSGNPGLGAVFAILETSHGILAAGLNGLAVLRGNRFEMVDFVDRISSRGVAGIVESANGDLWLNASHGVVRIPVAELQTALSNPHYRMKTELLAEGDFVGPSELRWGKSTTARDADGKLWFATTNGVFHIDPRQNVSGAHLPIVSIKSISADGTALDSSGTIGPRSQSLNIQYLGVNLTAPENVTYRYRLDGFDDSWQDAGHRTLAIYPHLSPGTYTFRVAASNDGTNWTPPVSSASIVVLPSFYQTRWFLVLCGFVVLAAIWFLFTLRLRAVTRDVRARAEERADERIRISRDLHDTLLQGIQGLLLTFHVAAQKVPADDDSRKLLDSALTTADRIIIEGRNRVNSLRSEHLTDSELTGSIENVGNDLRIDNKVAFHVVREGIDAMLHAHIADEVFYIAREALTNAFRHSGASEIVVKLAYGPRYFSMSCKDNGRGFDSSNNEKPGHWGLTGMSERAQGIGGELRCRSETGRGTEILFTLPSYRAYKSYSRFMFYLNALRPSVRNPVRL